jgi:hypothetical protein
MRIHSIPDDETAELSSAFQSHVQRLMLDRAGQGLEQQRALTARLDCTLALKKRLEGIAKDVTLVEGSSRDLFPALDGIDQAAAVLFGDNIPQVLREAVLQHRAVLAIALVGAGVAGERVKVLLDAAKALLEAFGPDGAHFAKPEAIALQEAVDLLVALPNGDGPNDEALAKALRALDGLEPTWAKFLRTIPGWPDLPEPADPITHPYGAAANGSPRNVEDCE